MNETTIIGNVGTLRFGQAGGTAVLNFSVAASRRSGDREYTDWVQASIWGDRATKLQPHICKGDKLLVRGRPEAKGFLLKNGEIGSELVVHVSDVKFLSPKKHSTPARRRKAES